MAGTEFTSSGGTQPAAVPGLTPGVTIFSTIGAAVAASSPGDTINVSDGTYAEHVVIGIPVTLQGNQFGVNGSSPGRVAETVVDGTFTDAPFDIAANNVVINGFKIVNGMNGFNAGVATTSAFGGYNIENNVITNNMIGVYANSNAASTVQNNLFDANNLPGPSGGAGLYSDQGAVGLTITGNEFRNHTQNNPILLAATSTVSYTNLTVSNNNLHDNVSGIFGLSINGGTFTGNTIRTSPAATALTFGGADTNIQVTFNDLSNNARGLRIADYGYFGAAPNSSITVMCNNFANDSDFGLGVIDTTSDGGNATAYTGALNATQNWWGDISGPTAAGNPGGTGSKIRNDNAPAVATFYSPWATSPDCLITTTGAPGAGLQTDPCDPSKAALVVFGTNDDEHIEVHLKDKTRLEVKIDSRNFKLTQTFNLSAVTGHIVVYGLNGNDHIEIENKVTNDAWLFGGNGDDHLQAGGGNTLLLGGAGNDHLEGGNARDVLIGGTGQDHLESKGGQDILIAGSTDFDNNLTALCHITMTWNATGPGYAARVAALSSILNSSTVHDDGVQDQLDGGSDLDWYFAHVTGAGAKDKISGLKSGEVVTNI
jgi:hypothetical protein